MPKHNSSSQTAKTHMTQRVLTVSADNFIIEVRDRLAEEVSKLDTISYIYVVDKQQRLIGVLSIQELFANKKTTVIKDVMITELYTVYANTHEEKVALLALKQNLKAIPVVDYKKVFQGVVPSDEILNILNGEHLEDALLSAGITSDDPDALLDDISNPSIFFHIKNRFGWLILGLAGSMITTLIVNSYDLMLEKQILLATFIPAIVYMSDAVGTQTQTVFIKSLAVKGKLDFWFYFFRELKTAFVMGLALSSIVFVITTVIWRMPMISSIFAISMLLAVTGSAGLAVFLPTFLSKFNIDPAVSSGPIASVMRDIMSLSIYLGFASLFIGIV